MAGRPPRAGLRAAALALLAVALLGWVLWRSDPRAVGAVLARATLPWLAALAGANLLGLAVRAWRWAFLLRHAGTPAWRHCFAASVVGYFSSIVTPVRAADVVRAAWLARTTGVRFATALSSALGERLIDTGMMLGLVAAYGLAVPGELGSVFGPAAATAATAAVWTRALAALLLFGSLLLVASPLYLTRLRLPVSLAPALLGRLPERWRARAASGTAAFAAGLGLAREPWRWIPVAAASAALWTLLAAQALFAAAALGVLLPARAGVLLTGAGILGSAIPTPAGVGGFHAACQVVLERVYGIGASEAAATALLFHLGSVLPTIVAGAVVLAGAGLSLQRLRTLAENTSETTGDRKA